MCVVFHTGVLVFSRVDRPERVSEYFIACSAVHQANTTITHPFSSREISDLSCPSAWQHQNDAIAPALDITPPEITRAAHAKPIVELPFRPDDWLCQATHRHTQFICAKCIATLPRNAQAWSRCVATSPVASNSRHTSAPWRPSSCVTVFGNSCTHANLTTDRTCHPFEPAFLETRLPIE